LFIGFKHNISLYTELDVRPAALARRVDELIHHRQEAKIKGWLPGRGATVKQRE
jgi:hypothetical protein